MKNYFLLLVSKISILPVETLQTVQLIHFQVATFKNLIKTGLYKKKLIQICLFVFTKIAFGTIIEVESEVSLLEFLKHKSEWFII